MSTFVLFDQALNRNLSSLLIGRRDLFRYGRSSLDSFPLPSVHELLAVEPVLVGPRPFRALQRPRLRPAVHHAAPLRVREGWRKKRERGKEGKK